LFATFAGWALSGRLAYYQYLIAIYALALATAAYLLWRIPRCGGALAERPMLECFSHIKVDRVLRDTLIAWMFLGFGNLMMLPLRIEYLANKEHGLRLSEVEITLLVATIPHLARLIASPMWGRLFDRLNFFSLRITVNLFFLLSVFSFFSSSSFASLAIAAAIFGFSNSGGDVAWSLWVTKFAPPSLVPDYMVVHTFFTGVRGVLAPMVAFSLLGILPLTTLMWISAALMSFATIQMFFIRERQTRAKS
jgi:MFS family permease